MPPTPIFSLVTPVGVDRSAALAAIHIHADVDSLFRTLLIRPVPIGGVALRDFGGHDRGVVARPDASTLLLMPHAGAAVLRLVIAWLVSRGVEQAPALPPSIAYPEASSEIEASMLAALAGAASPIAIDLLLDQPRRWKAFGVETLSDASTLPPGSLDAIRARSRVLNRLLRPPTVVALGPPNIGKSTLLNTLARRAVSIVADEPGTTRDHVGVRLDLAGLVVHYIDAPGIDASAADPIQRESQEIALNAAAGADLVLLCADPTSEFLARQADRLSLRVCLRCDRAGKIPDCDAAVSSRTGEGMEGLVTAIKQALMPRDALDSDAAWMWWDG